MTKSISSKEFMYVGIVILLPTILLFNSFLLYAVGALAIAVLLIFVDPLFKRFRCGVVGSEKFIVGVLGSGILAGISSTLMPDYHVLIVSAWSIFYLVWGMKIAKRIDNVNDK